MELGPYESIGLDDCPPATGIPDDTRGQLLLTGTERAKRRAQRVYHAVLVQRLAERKLTAQQLLEEQIGWFWLRFTPEELDDLLESAAEVYSDVERVDERGDTTAKYRATPKGEKLPKPRSVSLTDPRNLLLLTREALRVWWTLLPAVLGIVGSAAVILIFERAWLLELVVAVAVLLSAFLVLLFGFLGELHLIAAAKAWPRLELYRPHFYKWVTHPWRQAFFPTAGWLLLTLLVSAFLLRRQTIGATIAAACAAALVASVMLVAYVRVRPWRDRSSDELRRVQECRASHQARLQ